MRYILLIHAEEEVWTHYDEKAQADQMNRHEDLDDAIAIARRIPVTTNGGVEIRKIEVGPLAG